MVFYYPIYVRLLEKRWNREGFFLFHRQIAILRQLLYTVIFLNIRLRAVCRKNCPEVPGQAVRCLCPAGNSGSKFIDIVNYYHKKKG